MNVARWKDVWRRFSGRGTYPHELADMHVVGRSPGEQARQALRNIRVAVEAAGGNLSDIVMLRIYFVHQSAQNIEAIGSALRDVFTTNPPASTWIGVSSLAVPDFLI